MSGVPQDKSQGLDEVEGEASEDQAQNGDAPAGVRARFSGRTAVGLVREHNEDNFVVADLAAEAPSPRDEICTASVPEEGLLFAVCDGMGGAAAGEVASQMAVDILFEAMRRGGPPTDRDDLARRLVGAVEEAGRRIYDEAQKERSRRGMGTTATATVLIDKVLFIAEVGDSRAYLLRNGALRQLTKDQSLVNQLIEAGHLTEEEADAFEHSNIILQALGTSESVQVDLTFVELRRGDRLMLCSDGLSGLVADDTIAETLQDVQDVAECTKTLIEYAENGGGHDNITVIVVDFDGDGLAPPRDSDTFGYVQYPLPLPEGDESAFHDDETTAAGIIGSDRSPPRDDGELDIDGGADQGTAMLWLVGGVVALLIGATVLALSSGQGTGKADEVAAGAEEVETATQAKAPPPEPADVAVRVHTDVQNARLLVNGESHGALNAGGTTDLSLSPGAYRLEAESEGNVEAVAVVTVRDGVPLDVHLKLPSGAEPGDAQDEARAESGEADSTDDGADDEAARELADNGAAQPVADGQAEQEDDGAAPAPGADEAAQVQAEAAAARRRAARRRARQARDKQRAAMAAPATEPHTEPKVVAPAAPRAAPSEPVKVTPVKPAPSDQAPVKPSPARPEPARPEPARPPPQKPAVAPKASGGTTPPTPAKPPAEPGTPVPQNPF